MAKVCFIFNCLYALYLILKSNHYYIYDEINVVILAQVSFTQLPEWTYHLDQCLCLNE